MIAILLAACDAPVQVTTVIEDDAGEPMLPAPDDAPLPYLPRCVGLECRIVECGNANLYRGTTISGRVLAPNGALPVYNALVYVPNDALDPLPEGATCPCCPGFVSGKPLALAVSDAHGNFVLKNVPSGPDVPVVVQLDKWRRTYVMPAVAQCTDNPMSVRLPGKRSEGDMPKIAVTTGGCDPLACVLPKLGIDASEFGVDSKGPERVILYQGAGGGGPQGMKPASALWGSATELIQFDLVLLSSECDANIATKTKPSALETYAKYGGRVFATGSQSIWASDLVSSWKSTAAWGANVTATAPFVIDVTSPRGWALAKWLDAAMGSTKYGELAIAQPLATVGATGQWTAYTFVKSGGGARLLLSFNTPIGLQPSDQWGRVTYAAMQVGSGTVDGTFPAGCSGALTPEEKAFAFMLFTTVGCAQ